MGALAGGAAAASRKGPNTILGRAWLSSIERGIVARWAGGAAGWTGGVWAAGAAGVPLNSFTFVLAAAALGAATAAQALAWLRSRRIRRGAAPPEMALSEQAKALMVSWPVAIGVFGPERLHGSRIVAESMREPAPGTFAFAVDLRGDMHAEDAVGVDLRKHLERALRMGVGTVELDINREDSGQVLITLTPARHLEKVAAVWEGPILHEDGSIPLAVTADGSDIHVALFNESGVEHGGIFGASNTGKSFTLASQLLPGVCEGLEVVVYIDGGNGTSASHLAGACDWWAVKDSSTWKQAIRSTHAVMRARKARRSAMGLSTWRGRAETDPVLTLVIDEATTVLKELAVNEVDMVMEILREGRKLGVRVFQITQDPMGEDLIGGRKARGQLGGNGTVIGHRPGDGVANQLTGSSTAQSIDLRLLPPEPGWCGIIRRGQVLAKAARVRYATEEKVQGVLSQITPRSLTEEDLTAAGSNYANRVRGQVAAENMRQMRSTGSEVLAIGSAPHGDVTDEAARGQDREHHDGVQGFPEREAPSPYVEADKLLNAAARVQKAKGEMNRKSLLNALRSAGDAGAATAELVKELGLSKSAINKLIRELSDQVERGEDNRARLRRDQAAA